MDETTAEGVKIVPASCTNCGGTVEVDPKTDTASCPFCGTTFIVDKAINNYTVKHANIEHADNVNIDVTGSVKTVLDFVGEQMREGRAERREYRKEAAENSRVMTKTFFKLMVFLFALTAVAGTIFVIVMQIIDPEDDSFFAEYMYSEDNVISCYIDDSGFLSVNITDPGESEWDYYKDGSSEKLKGEDSDFDGYHFTIKPAHEDGTGYAVVAEYEDRDASGAVPDSYGVVRFEIEDGKVDEIEEIAHITDLSQYNFTW